MSHELRKALALVRDEIIRNPAFAEQVLQDIEEAEAAARQERHAVRARMNALI